MHQQSEPKLLYFKSRGAAQPIRILLIAMQVPFQDIFIDKSVGIPKEMSHYEMEVDELPYLLHGGRVIQGIFPIMKYVCFISNHPHLLGKTIEDGIRIAEIFVKFSVERNRILSLLKEFIEKNMTRELKNQDLIEIRSKICKCNEETKYYRASLKFLEKSHGFLLGYPTVIDFIFYELTFFISHLTEAHQFHPIHFYKNFFESQGWYQENRQKIESYPVFCPNIPQQALALLLKVWIQ